MAEAGPRRHRLSSPGTRVLLVGTGTHDEKTSGLKPIHSVEHTLVDLRRAFIERCGVPEEAVIPLYDPPTPAVVVAQLRKLLDEADNALWVHFVGHGLELNEPAGDGVQAKLYLATLSTTWDEYQGLASSVRYDQISMMLRNARASTRVIVLDCCFSGRAIGMAGDEPAARIERLTRVDQVHVLTATAGSEQALAPVDQPHTAFTGAFIRFLRTGAPAAGRELTMADAHRFLRDDLEQHSMSPRWMAAVNDTEPLVLAANPAYRPAPLVEARTPRTEHGEGWPACPYPDALAVAAGNAGWLYGRQTEIRELITRMDRRFDAGGPVVLRAAPGSGTTSLLRSGLIQALKAEGLPDRPGSAHWPSAVVALAPVGARGRPDPLGALAAEASGLLLSAAPGADPASLAERMRADPQALADYLRAVLRKRAGAGDPAADRVILVLDQYEEVDRLAEDDPDRAAFVAALDAACTPADGRPAPALLLVATHADATDPCGAGGLTAPRGARPYELPPLTGRQLSEAVEAPAQEAGVHVSPDLASVIEYDLGSAAAVPLTPGAVTPGRLPLIVRALRASWDHLEGGDLTVDAYRAGGGIPAAAAALAQDAYDELDDTEKDAARTLLLRMVRIAEDSEGIRHVDLSRLVADSREPATAERTAALLVRRHVIVSDGDHSRLIHRELPRWDRLSAWIAADRAALMQWQRLLDGAEAWAASRGDPALLPGEHDLEVAQELKKQRRELFTPQLELFLDEGTARRAARQRRTVTTLIGVLTAIAVLAVAVLGIAVYAFHQKSQADAVSAQLTLQRDQGESQEIAAVADAQRGTDPAAAALLAVDALAVSQTSKSVSSLLSTQSGAPAQRIAVGHGGLNAVAAMSTGSYAATADQDGTVCVIPVGATGGEPAVLPGQPHPSPAYAVATSPDGRRIAAGHADGTVELWERKAKSWTPAGRVAPGPAAVNALSFNADGSLLATGGDDGTLRLWDTAGFGGTPAAQSVSGRGPIEAVAFAPSDPRTLVVGNQDGTAAVVSLSSGKHPTLVGEQIVTGGTQPVDAVAISPNDSTVATGSDDGTVRLWSMAAVSKGLLAGPASRADALAFSRDGLTLAVASQDGAVRLWSTATGDLDRMLTGPGPHISGLTYLAGSTGTDILVGAGSGGTVGLWPVDGPQPQNPQQGVGQSSDTAAFGAAGSKLVATVGTDRLIRLWHLGTPAPYAVIADPTTAPPPSPAASAAARSAPPPGPVPTRRLAFSPDGSQLAFVGDSGAIVLWDLNAMREMTTLAVEPHPPGTAPFATAVAYSRDGTMLAAADSDRDLLVWDTRDYSAPARRLPLDNQLDPINAIAFRGDGVLASASDDRTVDLAYVPPPPQPFAGDSLSPAAAGHLVPVEAVGFSADGTLLASGDTDGETRLWRVQRAGTAGSADAPPTLTTPQSLAVLSGPTQTVVSVAFSGDDRLLASASEDRTVTLWSATGAHEAVATLSGLPAPSSAALAPDMGAAYLVTSDDGGMATFWFTDPKAVARQICADHGPLTKDQWDRYILDKPYLDGCARLFGGAAATGAAASAQALVAAPSETSVSLLASLSLDAPPPASQDADTRIVNLMMR